MADETEALRLTDEALDRALRICRARGARGHRRGDGRLPNWATCSCGRAWRGLLDRRLVAGPILDRAVRSDATRADAGTGRRRRRQRLVATLGGVDGGLERFLATGPVRHPRYRLFAADVRCAPPPGSGRPRRVSASRIRLLVDGIDDYFFTKNGTPRKKWTSLQGRRWAGQPHAQEPSRAGDQLAEPLGDDLRAFRRDLNAVLTRGVWKLFRIARDEYRDVLDEHAVVDFPDALERALGLLAQRGEFTRSRYLLESRYHHLLVDEFQDTSDAQWQLVWHLVQSWREGVGMEQDQPLAPDDLRRRRPQAVDLRVPRRRRPRAGAGGRADSDSCVAIATSAARFARASVPSRRCCRSPTTCARRSTSASIATTPSRTTTATSSRSRPSAVDRVGTGARPDRRDGPRVAGRRRRRRDRACDSQRRRARSPDGRRQAGRPPATSRSCFARATGIRPSSARSRQRGIPSYVYKGLGFFDADEVKDVFALLRYLANPVSELRAAAFLRSRFVRLSDVALVRLAPELAAAMVRPAD